MNKTELKSLSEQLRANLYLNQMISDFSKCDLSNNKELKEVYDYLVYYHNKLQEEIKEFIENDMGLRTKTI